MDQAFKRRLIGAMADAIIAHAEELTALDSAIGDGDHGLNMKRGFEAVLADADGISAKPLPDALKAIGMALVMKVGGASGPLYGTLAMGLGKALPPEPSAAEAAAALGRAIEDVKARGKSEAGQKTMLDVLIPVQAAFAADGDDLATRLPAVAAEAADATVPMKAIRGRASFLGERSIGHMDPGARSSSLLVQAICSVFNEV
ncbi:PTS-dependent dihydroxyacetone kinase, ADP-binding subunit DhaL (Glycerone kinase) (DHA kinase) [Bradyrhizobium sp. ORS 278]|uniref:dihydroxyacetone kinase subunit DhaL n=1 Tax=Bradyrhizobium sp. (strain ORS 278) TaxID=114615 RepID=UPI0001508C9E|nr:dihydroxyacetone kinase subunit DhaL [Bradyrhizobium sp. ORS 278]CAL78346.1 PTS-dependent dihydroxyacetone kinase, ADP-binding subunit DhaL (Glycerone kinase) (DHA kinase) [Bradyrhizobium sp. ORS 278]